MSVNAPALPANLVEKYLAQLATRRAELEKFLRSCEQQTVTPDDRATARIHGHSLKGTGRTYGYPTISSAGSALEEAIDANADQPTLATLARALLAACDIALEGFKPSAPAPLARGDNGIDIRSVKAAMQAADVQKSTILIVDDDPAIRGMLQQLLSRDADIVTASDCAEALELIERNRPDLVILDDRMPGMSGLEMLERMRADGKPLLAQIVMLTANNRTPDIISGMSAGAVDYVTKPFEPDRLVIRIRSLLQRLRMTILVADDDAAVRGLLQHKFRMLGFRVLFSEDGEDAMRMMRTTRPQLAIIDRMMPGLDGLAVLQKIRAEENLKATPVILLTAKRQNKDVVEGFHEGATDYIVKPFLPDEVVARAMRLLNLKEVSRP